MKRLLKGLGYAVAGLVALVLVLAVGIYGVSEARFRKQFAITPSPVAVPTDSASLARGRHLTTSVGGCVECHGENLAGQKLIDDPAMGRLYATNLTRGAGGVGGTLSDIDFVRAIRHGLTADGRGLMVMPSSDYMNLSDQDLGAIIAYVKSVPPVDNTVPVRSAGPVVRALTVAGLASFLHAERIDHERKRPGSVQPAVTAGYGSYLASVGCEGCHGATLAGGKMKDGDPSWPPAANLTPAGNLKSWTDADFRRLLREGKRPDGIPISSAMPWKIFGRMTDDEIQAIWLYLKTLPPTPTPGLQTASR